MASSPLPLRRGWADCEVVMLVVRDNSSACNSAVFPSDLLVCFHYKRLSDHLICIMNIFGILKPDKLKPVV
uniref:Uncharacterized protein n=1 Tax=Oryza punctata TaxID=4537 RepID=A0A0E0MJF3_ORYPU